MGADRRWWLGERPLRQQLLISAQGFWGPMSEEKAVPSSRGGLFYWLTQMIRAIQTTSSRAMMRSG